MFVVVQKTMRRRRLLIM